MQEHELLESLNVIPEFTNVVDPILASGQEAPTPEVRTQSVQVPVAVSTQPGSTNGSLPQQQQKFSDYNSYGYTSPWVKDKCCEKIPDYRLATSCANCAFSTYEPVNGEAICKKWQQRVVPFYYCDSHIDPSSLINPSDTEENFSESEQPTVQTEQTQQAVVATNSEFPDQELYNEALSTAPSFVNQAGVKDETLTNLYVRRKYEQLVKQKRLKPI